MSNFGLEPWSVGLGSPLPPAILAPPSSLPRQGSPTRDGSPYLFPAFSPLHQNLLMQMCTWEGALRFQGSLPKVCEVTFASAYSLFGAWGQGRNVQTPMTPESGPRESPWGSVRLIYGTPVTQVRKLKFTAFSWRPSIPKRPAHCKPVPISR